MARKFDRKMIYHVLDHEACYCTQNRGHSWLITLLNVRYSYGSLFLSGGHADAAAFELLNYSYLPTPLLLISPSCTLELHTTS